MKFTILSSRWLLALCPVFFASGAGAQLPQVSPRDGSSSASTDPIRAGMLYEEGRRLASSRAYEQAVAKFQESFALHRQVRTLLNMGDAYEKLGKYGSAYHTFQKGIDLAHELADGPRGQESRRRLGLVEGLAARIVIQAPVTGFARPMRVMLEGVERRAADWSVPYYADLQTEYRIEILGEGCKPAVEVVRPLEAGRLYTVKIPSLQSAPGVDGGTVPGDGGAYISVDASGTTGDAGLLWDGGTQGPETVRVRWPAYLVGGVGLAAIGVGAYFGVSAMLKRGDVQSKCPDLSRCTAEGKSLNDEALRSADLSTIFIGAGLGAVGAGVILFFVAPVQQKTGVLFTPSFGMNGAGVDAKISF